MDIARPSNAKQKRIRQAIYAGIGLLAVVVVSVGLSRLRPAAPTVERAVVWPDTVKRGQMILQVRGLGTLVPEDIRWIPATTQARVENIVLRPGTTVKPDRRSVARNWLNAAAGGTGLSVESVMVPLTRGSTTMLRPVMAAMVRATASISALTKFSVTASLSCAAAGHANAHANAIAANAIPRRKRKTKRVAERPASAWTGERMSDETTAIDGGVRRSREPVP